MPKINLNVLSPIGFRLNFQANSLRLKRFVTMLLLHLVGFASAQQMMHGRITDEDQNPLNSVLVINMKSGVRVNSDADGFFEIQGQKGEEVRFVRENVDRKSAFFKGSVQQFISVELNRATIIIEEVKINPIKLSGNLSDDSKNLTKVDRTEKLNSDVGVPPPPEKPREKAADLKQDVLKPLLTLSIRPQAIYELISGDARRKKSLYRFEDEQDNIAWLRYRLEDSYFSDAGIPIERISEFIQFCLRTNGEMRDAVKVKNLSKVTFIMEQNISQFQQRLQLK